VSVHAQGQLMRALDRAGIEYRDLLGCEFAHACCVIYRRLCEAGFDGNIVPFVTSMDHAVAEIDAWHAKRGERNDEGAPS
jgi:hypothetical protein